MFNLSSYVEGFLNHKLFDRALFEDFRKMHTEELLKWNRDFVEILTKAVPFSKAWNELIDIQKAYFNSWLALNTNLLSDSNSKEKLI